MIDLTNYQHTPDLTGRRFRHFSVLRYHGTDRYRDGMWHCQCQPCGRHVLIHQKSLIDGHADLCADCFESRDRGEVFSEPILREFTPIDSHLPRLRQFYDAMIQRSDNVCTRWKNSYESFANAMGDPPFGFLLTQIDVHDQYRTVNVQWQPLLSAFRLPRGTFLFKNGQVDTIKGWSLRMKRSEGCLEGRLRSNLSDEEVLSAFSTTKSARRQMEDHNA